MSVRPTVEQQRPCRRAKYAFGPDWDICFRCMKAWGRDGRVYRLHAVDVYGQRRYEAREVSS